MQILNETCTGTNNTVAWAWPAGSIVQQGTEHISTLSHRWQSHHIGYLCKVGASNAVLQAEHDFLQTQHNDYVSIYHV